MGWRTTRYGPRVTSSGSAFCVIGIPQLRPRKILAQTATPIPQANATVPAISWATLWTASALPPEHARDDDREHEEADDGRSPGRAAGVRAERRELPVRAEADPDDEDRGLQVAEAS